MNTEFKNLAEYKQFVADWKELYKQLTSTIRTVKRADRNIATVCRGEYRIVYDPKYNRVWGDENQTQYYRKQVQIRESAIEFLQLLAIKNGFTHSFTTLSTHFYVHTWKKFAKELLEIRKAGKIRSHAQWMADKALEKLQKELTGEPPVIS